MDDNDEKRDGKGRRPPTVILRVMLEQKGAEKELAQTIAVRCKDSAFWSVCFMCQLKNSKTGHLSTVKLLDISKKHFLL